MGSAMTFDSQCLRHGRVEISFAVLPNNTGTPKLSGSPPGVASVVRSSTGLFLVTLKDRYKALEGFSTAMMQDATAELDADLATESVNNATPTVTVRITNKATGNVADLAASTDNRIGVVLVLRNTAR